MPLELPNGQTYKLCLLDTNALSEIVKRPATEGRGFLERYPPSEFVPCFTVYNIIELRCRPDVFQKFKEFFSVYPSVIARPLPAILELEIRSGGRAVVKDCIYRAFTPLGPNDSYDINRFIDELFGPPELQHVESQRRDNNKVTLAEWLSHKDAFESTKPDPNTRDALRYVFQGSTETLCRIAPEFAREWLTSHMHSPFPALPSLRMSLFSQYYRLFDSHWQPKGQEVTDVQISACAPYVDAVVTESFQAEIYKKCRKHVDGMCIEVASLRDIRHNT